MSKKKKNEGSVAVLEAPTVVEQPVVTEQPVIEAPTEQTVEQTAAAMAPQLQTGHKSTKVNLRPNVKFTLALVPPAGSMPPQVHQLIDAFVAKAGAPTADSTPTLSEEEVFAAVNDAASKGIIKTRQDPFRIFRYYLPTMKKTGVLQQAA